MAAGVCAKSWIVLKYKGLDGLINGLSYAYYGIWEPFSVRIFISFCVAW